MRIKVLLLALLASLLPAAAMGTPQDDFAVVRVTDVLSERREDFAGIARTVRMLRLRVESGPQKGQEFTLEQGALDGRADMHIAAGDRMVIEFATHADGSVLPLLREKYRLPSLLWMTAGFVGLTLLLGGLTGLTSLLGLAVSVAILLLFVIPRIVAGSDPLAVSVIGCGLIATLSLYLAHGRTRRTSVALLATILTLCIAAAAAVVAVHAASLFGMGSEESVFLQSGVLASVNLRGLLLGGMLLGALGVLDDITTAQCAAVEEISRANPRLSVAELMGRGASVGREHIASLINTLALAYAGTSLPLLLLLDVNGDFPLWVTLNGEFLAEEIVRTLVGSVALLCAVPISTALAARLLRADSSHPPASFHAHHHGHHH